MLLKYVGPFDGVTVVDLGVDVEQGGTIEVPDDMAEGFIHQAVWQAVDASGAPLPQPDDATPAENSEGGN